MSTTIENPMTEAEVARLNSRVPECIGATEFAQMLGTNRSNLRKIARLPEAIEWSKDLARGEMWRRDVAERFAAERRERYGLIEPPE